MIRVVLLAIVLAAVGCGNSPPTVDPDAGCVDPCGSACCAPGESCSGDKCVAPCMPRCDGRDCGDDGCGARCGTCPTGSLCGEGGVCETCVPRTCTQLGLECGEASDGCGGAVQCGACMAGEGCNAGVCEPGGCVAETDLQFCERYAATCGTLTNLDDCDHSRTVDCGDCTSTQTCGLLTANLCAEDCRKGSSCAGLTWCDSDSGLCKPGCSTSTQCGANEQCTLASHTCECEAGFHPCSGACVPDTSPLSCGTSCTPCPVPESSVATCDGTQCGFACDAGFLSCGSGCIACSDPNGTASCSPTNTCLIACDAGFHPCGDRCVSDTSVDSCGTSCTACPTDPNGTATCDGSGCGFSCGAGFLSCGSSCIACSDPNGAASCSPTNTCLITCEVGFHPCDDRCVSDNSVDSCGTSCVACPTDPNGTATCDGTGCGFSCDSGYHACGGQCVSNTSIGSCGASCTACPTDPNGTATCDGTNCGFSCDSGYTPCGGQCVSILSLGFSDDHDDGVLTGWIAEGSRSWSETGGYAVTQDAQTGQGFLLHEHANADDGTFEVVLRCEGAVSANSRFGGFVFRYTDPAHFYEVALRELDTSGAASGNGLFLLKNTTDFDAAVPGVDLIEIAGNLDLSGFERQYPLKVVISGSVFAFYLDNVQVGSVTASENPTGRVGYSYHNVWNRYVSVDYSQWTDSCSN